MRGWTVSEREAERMRDDEAETQEEQETSEDIIFICFHVKSFISLISSSYERSKTCMSIGMHFPLLLSCKTPGKRDGRLHEKSKGMEGETMAPLDDGVAASDPPTHRSPSPTSRLSLLSCLLTRVSQTQHVSGEAGEPEKSNFLVPGIHVSRVSHTCPMSFWRSE